MGPASQPKLQPPTKGPRTIEMEVAASGGVVVTDHPLASAAGMEMFARGGNAFDAAVASLFTLSVVEPMMVGVFGAGFSVIRKGHDGTIEAIDNSAVAPRASSDDMYIPAEKVQPDQSVPKPSDRRNEIGYLSVATPGALKAWEHMAKKYGELNFSEIIDPALRHARHGFKASHIFVQMVDEKREDLLRHPETARIFLPGGRVPRVGDNIVQTDYASSLEKIAVQGSDALYRGELGEAIVEDVQANGGILTGEDLKEYKLMVRRPLRGTYRGAHEVYTTAPPSSGGAHLIQMLNVLENFDLASMGFGSADHLHLLAETMKMAYADRQQYMGDPERVMVPVAGITSKPYAEKCAGKIRMGSALSYGPGDAVLYEVGGGNTTHVSAFDSDGNMVASTQSISSPFGSGVTVRGTGILLNNFMGAFDPLPGKANSVSSGKRALSSLTPAIFLRKGEPFMCVGTPCGKEAFATICQTVVNIVDFGMTIQQAVEAPRIWTTGIQGTGGEMFRVEPGFEDGVLEELGRRGHELTRVPMVAGGMKGVLFNPMTGLMYGAACWRSEGSPMGYSNWRRDLRAPPSSYVF